MEAIMFEDSVLENRIPRKRRWTTVASFAIECAGILVLVLIPLLYTEALPNLNLMTRIEPPTAPPAPKPVEVITTIREESRNHSEFVNNVLIPPQRIPPTINQIVDNAEPPDSSSSDPNSYVPWSTGPSSSSNRNIADMLGPRTTIVPTLRPPTVYRISHLDEGQIIRRVQPTYPAIARQTRTQGPVLLEALIAKDGRIEHLSLISGHPLLVHAAMDAVQQWRYRPYLLNGSPVEVQTTITVNFYLNSN
jgi:periplasmic protein TonB